MLVRRAFCLMTAVVLFAGVAGIYSVSQSAAVSWVTLDGSKSGTPADVVLSQEESSASATTFSIVLHGFWTERKDGPGGPYTKITIPGMGSVQQRGAPSLPSLKLNLAIPTSAAAAKLRSATASETRQFPGVLIWPNPVPETDQDEGTPEQFMIDSKIYGQSSNWPGSSADAGGAVRPKLGSIKGVTLEAYPIQWNPATRMLTVNRITKYSFDHSGTATTGHAITKDRGLLASKDFTNWTAVATYYPINILWYEGDFLFIYPDGYKDELQPLIDQKKARGFWVTEMTTTATGHTCTSIRTAINNWYNGRPNWSDKYALLVGDVNEIPLCTAPTGTPTDDLYASTNGDDLDEEIFLGRLSVDDETDAANQVAKILSYEDHPDLYCCYDEALLVAHKQGAPGKYVGAHESVRTAVYSTPPIFSTLYGSVAGVANANVSASINSGLGLVAYRGHGSTGSWSGWNLLNESYGSADLAGLTNVMPRIPILWSFTCNNSNLTIEDSIAEKWMESPSSRAVSHYGATIPSYTDQNHELDRRMFKAVYDLGLTTESHAIQYAEDQMSMIVGSENAWMYLLLGDPDLQIRRRNVLSFVVRIDTTYILPCKGPGCWMNINVTDKYGNPIPGVRVGAWKGGKSGDEMLNNRYTDPKGNASIPLTMQTAGTLYYSLKDDSGNNAIGQVIVK